MLHSFNFFEGANERKWHERYVLHKLIFIQDKTIQLNSEVPSGTRKFAAARKICINAKLPEIKLLFATYVSARLCPKLCKTNFQSEARTFPVFSRSSLGGPKQVKLAPRRTKSLWLQMCKRELRKIIAGLKMHRVIMGLAMVEHIISAVCGELSCSVLTNGKLFIAARKFLSCDNLSFEGTPGIIMSVRMSAFNYKLNGMNENSSREI